MPRILNLRTARKRKARDAAARTADENAARRGRAKTDIALNRAQAEKAARDLDGHRRERLDGDDDQC